MDPIKPFTTLIRSLRRAGETIATRGASESAATNNSATTGVTATAPVQERLNARLATLTPWDAKRARELFVESTLLREFGTELASDPGFFDLIQRVSTHLSNEVGLSETLDRLLRELAFGPAKSQP